MAQLIKLQKGSNYIMIETTKVEESLVNKLIKIQRPVVKGNQNTYNPGTGIVDIKRIEHIFTIDGFISYDENTHIAGVSDATGVKNFFIRNILYPKGEIELFYRNQKDSDYGSYYWNKSAASTEHIKTNLDKVTIRDVALRGGDSTNSPKRYGILINLTRGKVK